MKAKVVDYAPEGALNAANYFSGVYAQPGAGLWARQGRTESSPRLRLISFSAAPCPSPVHSTVLVRYSWRHQFRIIPLAAVGVSKCTERTPLKIIQSSCSHDCTFKTSIYWIKSKLHPEKYIQEQFTRRAYPDVQEKLLSVNSWEAQDHHIMLRAALMWSSHSLVDGDPTLRYKIDVPVFNCLLFFDSLSSLFCSQRLLVILTRDKASKILCSLRGAALETPLMED